MPKMMAFGALVLALCVPPLCVPALAQTIVGESTYEDNFLHKPPPAPREVTPAHRSGEAAQDPQRPSSGAPTRRD